ncbi:major facilitator superfamily MFS_1 [Candidatus Protofrankia datiscae]|uniref:Major facilitator superfamily MFS_1 n=2 Tax=Frankiaceae TaxID=74712 RepID=F8AX07_9ACTN|nr:major facilitator superfamily MFS_1 [Candidatus Protofrankia datiscae]
MRDADHAEPDAADDRDAARPSAVVDESAAPGLQYKWIALSNTTLGILMATINSSIVLIALPDIFRGININPLEPGNTSYLLWMMLGFLIVTAVLVVTFGRLGDMYGRVRMYNMGFAIFSVSSVLLALTWMDGSAAALWLIGWRIVQGVGGAFIFANSTAILTDAFPVQQRGLALGINVVSGIAGTFIGLLLGGVLAPVNWHYVFLVSVPFGVFGTFWAYAKLRDNGVRQRTSMDWWGNATFASGLIILLVGITYGIQPYGGHTMGWTNPWVLSAMIGGLAVLVAFAIIESKIREPLFDVRLFRIRSFTAGNIASLLASLGRGGLQFVLIIWLQGIWLPQHGYSFTETPLWAGIYMIPLTIGFLLAAPVAGALSDRFGARIFTVGGLVIVIASFVLFMVIPVNFSYLPFALILFINGIGTGLFSSPNRADVMNGLPANKRGVGAGMTATFQNSAIVLSIGLVFILIVAGLSRTLPATMFNGLLAQGVPDATARTVADLPPIGVLFSAFLGYNPMEQLLTPQTLAALPDGGAHVTGHAFFPNLISGPFADGLAAVFVFSITTLVIAAIASFVAGSGQPAAPASGTAPVNAEPVSVRRQRGGEPGAGLIPGHRLGEAESSGYTG